MGDPFGVPLAVERVRAWDCFGNKGRARRKARLVR